MRILLKNWLVSDILNDGTVMTWGNGNAGQLGDGVTFRENPAIVPGLTNVKDITLGDRQVYAMLEDGTILAWGDDISPTPIVFDIH